MSENFQDSVTMPDGIEFERFSYDDSFFSSVGSSLIESLTYRCFERLSFTFVRAHIEHLIAIVTDKASSKNDRLVASHLLQNAEIASQGIYPLCQDTGIACVFGWKGSRVVTQTADASDGIGIAYSDEEAISRAVSHVYSERFLRFSTVLPTSLFDEYDPANNLPAQIMLFADRSLCPPRFSTFPFENTYQFLFCAKGGGSSNKTTFIQGTKALLNEASLEALLQKEIPALGTTACPPYTIVLVVGGLSPEHNMITQKLACSGAYDYIHDGMRDAVWEQKVCDIARSSALGAQFGGTALAAQARVIRLPRHAASVPISLGVSCCAHRNLHAYIDPSGIYIEKTVQNLHQIEGFTAAASYVADECIHINFDEGLESVLPRLRSCALKTRILISGKVIVARDAAHARWKQRIDEGKPLPDYTQYPVFYAGPAETPDGCIVGSFGPTTAGRMDDYATLLMSRNASLISIAKGNRSEAWTATATEYGAVYLGVIGGASALIAREHITNQCIIDYADLGMEAVRLVTLKNLTAFILHV